MPLTPDEVTYLRGAVGENMRCMCGPAWTALHARGIWNRDLSELMDAYVVFEWQKSGADVMSVHYPEVGPAPEVCPWADAEDARRRGREVWPEVEAIRAAGRGRVS